MPNPGDFDPAKAIQGVRQQRAAEEAGKQREEAGKQRIQAQEDLRRASIRKLLRYADEQLEKIRNPIVSEFVICERWWTPEQISDRRNEEAFKRTLRPDQEFMHASDQTFFQALFTGRLTYTVATRHYRELARYHGSWLSLRYTSDRRKTISALVKLRQPRAGYAHVDIHDWDPRNVGNIYQELNTFDHRPPFGQSQIAKKSVLPLALQFRIFASLEDAAECHYHKGNYQRSRLSVEEVTKQVTQALDFVATGQPPELEWIESWDSGPDYS